MKNSHYVVVTLLLLAANVSVGENALIYVAGETKPGSAIQIIETPSAAVLMGNKAGKTFAGPSPNTANYFERIGLSFRIEPETPFSPGPLTLIIEHLDEGLGLISVQYDSGQEPRDNHPGDRPPYTAAKPLAGYTTLGTEQQRTAVFLLESPAFAHRQKDGADLTIDGVRALTRLTLIPGLDDEAVARAKNEIPKVTSPRVVLSRPMELVTTAGAHSGTAEDWLATRDRMREMAPLARALGFTAIESYVTWRNVAPERNRFDWTYYDNVAMTAKEYGLRWFPLLIVGSSYSLPDWFHDSEENIGFVCLEHGKGNNIQTIFCDKQNLYVQGFLNAFGAHYQPMDVLLGVRLGPSGNYGESQYPAGGNWGYRGQREHIHIGWWAGDEYAPGHFRAFLQAQYPSIAALNAAWQEDYASFDEVPVFIPQFAETMRKRKDFVDWYMDAMTEWCEQWAVWARDAMPHTTIYQSSGGWGFVESGTDFTDQTKSMRKVAGGIRATNETDSYAQNFYATRMMSSSARFYGVPFGSEPAGFGSGRAMAARIYNLLVNNGQHLFFYESNLTANDQAIDQWLKLAPLLDQREEPFIEVAALYPDTKSKLDDGVFRNLYAFTFNERVAALRPKLDFDFCSERMILDGALPRYKVLIFIWSNVVEKEVLDKIDAWVREGGVVIYPYWHAMPLMTVEGDYGVYNRWLRGDSGNGMVIFDRGDRVPAHRYADFIAKHLDTLESLDPRTKTMLRAIKPDEVYVSALKSGRYAVLNYNDASATIELPGLGAAELDPYSIKLMGE